MNLSLGVISVLMIEYQDFIFNSYFGLCANNVLTLHLETY